MPTITVHVLVSAETREITLTIPVSTRTKDLISQLVPNKNMALYETEIITDAELQLLARRKSQDLITSKILQILYSLFRTLHSSLRT